MQIIKCKLQIHGKAKLSECDRSSGGGFLQGEAVLQAVIGAVEELRRFEQLVPAVAAMLLGLGQKLVHVGFQHRLKLAGQAKILLQVFARGNATDE